MISLRKEQKGRRNQNNRAKTHGDQTRAKNKAKRILEGAIPSKITKKPLFLQRKYHQREENEKNYQEKLLLLSKNINKKKQLTDKLEEENKQLYEKDIAINEAIKEENNKTVEYKNEIEKLYIYIHIYK